MCCVTTHDWIKQTSSTTPYHLRDKWHDMVALPLPKPDRMRSLRVTDQSFFDRVIRALLALQVDTLTTCSRHEVDLPKLTGCAFFLWTEIIGLICWWYKDLFQTEFLLYRDPPFIPWSRLKRTINYCDIELHCLIAVVCLRPCARNFYCIIFILKYYKLGYLSPFSIYQIY